MGSTHEPGSPDDAGGDVVALLTSGQRVCLPAHFSAFANKPSLGNYVTAGEYTFYLQPLLLHSWLVCMEKTDQLSTQSSDSHKDIFLWMNGAASIC